MLLRSQRVVIESRLSPDAVLAQLELRAHELHEPALTPADRASNLAGIATLEMLDETARGPTRELR